LDERRVGAMGLSPYFGCRGGFLNLHEKIRIETSRDRR
jgi:hypothetical protein